MRLDLKLGNKHQYTNFSMRVQNIQSREEFNDLIEAMNMLDLIDYAFKDGVYVEEVQEAYFESWESIGWRCYLDDMCELSEVFPDFVFEITALNEGWMTWKVYFQDGVYEGCLGNFVYEEPVKIPWKK